MANALRLIALTVTEPAPGLFHWLLLERDGEDGDSRLFERCVMAADEPYDSFDKAARAGLLQWTRLAEDGLRRGPRKNAPSQPLEPMTGPSLRSV